MEKRSLGTHVWNTGTNALKDGLKNGKLSPWMDQIW